MENLIKFCPTKEEMELLKVNMNRVLDIVFILCHFKLKLSLHFATRFTVVTKKI